MPISYKLPKLKKPDKEVLEVPVEDDEWMRRIHIPVSKEQVQSLNVGDEETITLKGKIVELESREREGQEKGWNELTISIDEVEVSAMNDFEKLVEED